MSYVRIKHADGNLSHFSIDEDTIASIDGASFALAGVTAFELRDGDPPARVVAKEKPQLVLRFEHVDSRPPVEVPIHSDSRLSLWRGASDSYLSTMTRREVKLKGVKSIRLAVVEPE